MVISSLVTANALVSSFFRDLVTCGAWYGGRSAFFSTITGVMVFGTGESIVERLEVTGGVFVFLTGALATGFVVVFFFVICGVFKEGFTAAFVTGVSAEGMILLFLRNGST